MSDTTAPAVAADTPTPVPALTAADFSTTRRYATATLPNGKRAVLRSLSESELAEWDSEILGKNGEPEAALQKFQRAKLIVRVLVNEQKERIFSDDQWQAVANADAALTTAIYRKAVKFLGLDRGEAEAEAKN